MIKSSFLKFLTLCFGFLFVGIQGQCYTLQKFNSTSTAADGIWTYNVGYTSGNTSQIVLSCTSVTMSYSATYSGSGSLVVANPGQNMRHTLSNPGSSGTDVIKFSFNTPVSINGLSIGDIDTNGYRDDVTITAKNGAANVPVTLSYNTGNPGYVITGNNATGVVSTFSGTTADKQLNVAFGGNVTEYTITYKNAGAGSQQFILINSGFSVCCPVPTCTGPSITSQPLSSQSILQYATPTKLSVTASGDPTLTYQWYEDTYTTPGGGTIITGATSATFTPPTGSSGTKYYYVVVTNSCSTATSNVSTVTVNPDFDGDGVTDNIDLDDDNDGILDAAEMYCDTTTAPNGVYPASTAPAAPAYTKQLLFFDWSGVTLSPTTTTATKTVTYNGVTYTATLSNYNTNLATDNTMVGYDVNTWAVGPSNMFWKYYDVNGTNFKEILYSPTQVTGINGFDITVTAKKGTVEYPVDLVVFDPESTDPKTAGAPEKLSYTTNASNFTLLEKLGTGTISATNITGEGTKTVTYLNTQTSDVNALYVTTGYSPKVTALATMNAASQQGVGFAIRLYCDTDNDGIPSFLDTDSDGDGCPDAVEGGDNITQAMLDGNNRINVAANGTTTPVVVDAQGVPVIVNSGSTYNVDGQAQGQTVNQANIVNPAAVGGTASSNQTICYNTAPTSLTLSGYTGTIQWQVSTDNTTFTNIASATSATYSPAALTQTTYYRAVVSSAGGCTSISTTVTITVNNCVDAVNDNYSSTPINSNVGGTTSSVLGNDTYNGGAPGSATTSNVNLTWQTTAPAGITLNPNGTITVAPGTASGTYLFTYQICDKINTTSCDTATAVILVDKDSDGDGVLDSIDLDDDNDGIKDADECPAGVKHFDDFSLYVSTIAPVAPIASSVESTEYPFNLTKTGTVPPPGEYAVALNPNAWFSSMPPTGGNAALCFDGNHTNTGQKVVYKVKNQTIVTGKDYDFSFNYFVQGTPPAPTFYVYVDPDGAAGPSTPQLINVLTTAPTALNFNAILLTKWKATATSSTAEFYIVNDNYTGDGIGRNFAIDNVKITSFDCDTDGDGTPDTLDLDSDGDGCFDAIEGDENVKLVHLTANGVIKTNAAGVANANSIATVDAQGVPMLVNSGGTADIGGDQGQGIGISGTAALNACKDTDGDGVADVDDLDDDNDGILDTVENPCVYNMSGNWTSSTLSAPVGNNVVKITSPSGDPQTTFAFSALETMNTNTALGLWSNPAVYGKPSLAVRFVWDNTAESYPALATDDGGKRTIVFTFTKPVNSFILNIDRLGGSEATGGTNRTNSTVLLLNTAGVTMQRLSGNNEFIVSDNSVYRQPFVPQTGSVSEVTADPKFTTAGGSLLLSSTQPFTSVSFVLSGIGPEGTGADVMEFVVEACDTKDTDGDGIPDYLDLDSDGDGCFDAIEGGENVVLAHLNATGAIKTNAAGVANANNIATVDAQGVPVLVNTGGAADTGTPTAGTQGQPLGTSTDASNSPCFLDAVNDINQVPQGVTATGSVLTNDETAAGSGPISVLSATYLNSAGVLTNLPLGTATQVYDAAGTLAGTMTLNSNGTYTFVPASGYSGTVPINYVAVNGIGSTDPATLSIEVIKAPTGGNSAPTAQNDTAYTEVGTSVSSNVLANDSDLNGNSLTVTSATGLTIGTATVVSGVDANGNTVANAGTLTLNADGTYTFVPNGNFVGTINPITYTISDGNGGTDTAVLSIVVLPNQGNNTFANDDANSALQGVTMTGNIKTNDTDPEGNNTTITTLVVNGVTYSNSVNPFNNLPTEGGGTISINPDTGAYTYVPGPNFVGTVSIIYTICDNGTPQSCDTATLYLTSVPLGVCYNPVTNTAPGAPVKHGITLLKRAGSDNGGWPMNRNSAHTVLESNTKGFVITRVPTSGLSAITNPVEGMMVYDTVEKCLKIYADGVWSCFKTPACA